MQQVITFRNDSEIQQALDELGATDGTRTKVIKDALLMAAVIRRAGGIPRPDTMLTKLRDDLAQADKALEIYLGPAA